MIGATANHSFLGSAIEVTLLTGHVKDIQISHSYRGAILGVSNPWCFQAPKVDVFLVRLPRRRVETISPRLFSCSGLTGGVRGNVTVDGGNPKQPPGMV